jgi:MFS family permease
LCSLSFLGMYVALYSAQNISGVLFLNDGYDSLGFYSNAFAYLGEGIGSIICVSIIMKMGSTKSMSRFAIWNLPFILSLILPAIKSMNMSSNSFFLSDGFVYIIVIITSTVNGFAMGIVQPASGNYVAECATEENKGFYFAFFWSFYMGSQVVGNLIAAFVLGHFPQIAYVLLMLFIGAISTALLFFLREPVSINNKTLVDPIDAHAPHPTVAEGAKKLVQLLFNRRFMWILPQTVWTGISIAYFSGNLVEMLQGSIEGDEKEKFKWSMLAMVFFGFGEIFGSFFIGYFIDKKSSRYAAGVNVLIMIILATITFWFIVIF